MTDGQTQGHMDNQRETIIPCHYHVVGYKKNKALRKWGHLDQSFAYFFTKYLFSLKLP